MSKTKRSKKPAANTAKKAAQKKSDALTRKALATIEANIARIDGEDRAGQQKNAIPKAKQSAKRASGLDLAAKVLVESKEPLDAKTIAQRVIEAGWKTSGKTPHAALYAAIIREINGKRAGGSRFKKTERGLFAAA